MAEQDTARTIIFDLVQLERLGAELERRWRKDPATKVEDVLTQIDPENHILYVPQLTRLLDDLAKKKMDGTLAPDDFSHGDEIDHGESMHRSLMATAMIEDSAPGSSRGTGKIFGGAKSSDGRSESSTSDTPERIDNFRILRELGAGAFGVVYLAEDESLQRKVAIKVPKVSDKSRADSYINEARKAAAIDSKGIVPIYHVGTKENGMPFVVQKLIDGPSLRLLLTRYGSLPPAHAVTLMRDVAIALGAAHRAGIYHRDLKPDNVLIDGSGVPWIADFGLAISESEQAQRKGEIAGTLIYMSPEQIQGRADWLDGRSDIWALGIMLYELLLGKPPFTGKNRTSLMEQICHREPRPLQQTSNDLAPLNDIFVRCCAKKPNDRYPTVEDLAMDLTEILEEGWLPAQPIDGSDLSPDQRISQYATDDGRGTRTRSGLGASGTRVSGRGSTRDGVGSGTQVASGHGSGQGSGQGSGHGSGTAVGMESEELGRGLSSHGSARGSSLNSIGSASLSGSASMSGPASQSVATPAVGSRKWLVGAVLACAAVALPLGLVWRNSRASAVAQPQLQENPIGSNKTTVVQDVPIVEATKADPNSNAMTKEQADGTEALPFIVAADGSGSHRTIKAAIAATVPGGFVHLKPGTYVESLRLDRPINLVGSGEPNECVISNTVSAPIEVACDLGAVRLSSLMVQGDARQTKTEFNAIDLTSGKLSLDNCHLSTQTYNAVKIKPGASLAAKGCTFFKSNQFAISAKSHIGLEVKDCTFYQSGIQVVEGMAAVAGCEFLGPEGVYVAQSGGEPTTVTNCTFKNCSIYGIAATDSAVVSAKACNFTNCEKAVLIAGSEAEINHCVLLDCPFGINLVGGKATVKDKTTITGGAIACGVKGGDLRIIECTLSGQSKEGVSVLPDEPNVTVETIETIIENSGTSALVVLAGTLKMEGGSVRDCKDTGIYLADEFTSGQIRGTNFVKNVGNAIVHLAGELRCEDVTISESEIGVSAATNFAPIKIDLLRVRFEKIDDFATRFYRAGGALVATLKQCDFADLPDDQQVDAVGGPTVTVYK